MRHIIQVTVLSIVTLFSFNLSAVPSIVPSLGYLSLEAGRINSRQIDTQIFFHTSQYFENSYNYFCNCECYPEHHFGINDGYGYTRVKRETNDDETGYSAGIYYYGLGFELSPCRNIILGFTFARTNNRTFYYNDEGRVKVENFIPGAYLWWGYSCGIVGWYASVIGSYHAIDYKNLFFTADGANSSAKFHGRSPTVEGKIGADFNFHSFHINPSTSAFYQDVRIHAFDTSVGVSYSKQSLSSLLWRAGLDVYWDWDLCFCNLSFRPHLWAQYQYEFLNDRRRITTLDDSGAPGESIQTQRPNRDSLLLGAGAGIVYCDSFMIFASYEATTLNKQTVIHNVRGTLSMRF